MTIALKTSAGSGLCDSSWGFSGVLSGWPRDHGEVV